MPRKNPRPQARMRREVLKAKMEAKAKAKAHPRRGLVHVSQPVNALALVAALTRRKPR